uniref:Uncharacterized protein n=1 Tax=Anguilla anguilla TaxID=7936 RepID=A0A0E9XH88_ANGAN
MVPIMIEIPLNRVTFFFSSTFSGGARPFRFLCGTLLSKPFLEEPLPLPEASEPAADLWDMVARVRPNFPQVAAGSAL